MIYYVGIDDTKTACGPHDLLMFTRQEENSACNLLDAKVPVAEHFTIPKIFAPATKAPRHKH